MKGLHVVVLLKCIAKTVGWYIVDNELFNKGHIGTCSVVPCQEAS